MTELHKKILELKNEGMSYKQISDTLKCSKGTISYYLGKGQKEKNYKRGLKFKKQTHPYLRKFKKFMDKKYTKKNKKTIINFYQKAYKFLNKGSRMEKYTIEDVKNKIGENPICYLTGLPININDTKSYQFDHIIPSSRGGDNTIDNLGICLTKINKAKHNLTKEEFIELCNLVVKYNT